ncbi:MAG TPA: acylneuraminate cytidylyltransferase family protein [Fluviicoccus sp.]|nr:acylneuraminate cytidylyltransferase family protein [Fluviicoccus sp.]
MATPAVIGIIPARAGSKRLPGKNVRELDGKPLLAWTIEAALASQALTEVLISTDSEAMADLAVSHGAAFPGLRSPALATDEAAVIDVAVEVLERLAAEGKFPDAVMLLQPTSPFRSPATIRRAVELFAAGGGESVVSVSPARTPPSWCRQIDAEGCLRAYPGVESLTLRKQDLPPAYELNGLIYIASRTCILERRSFYTDNTLALVTEDPEEALDIDTPFDWMIAEACAARRRRSSKNT